MRSSCGTRALVDVVTGSACLPRNKQSRLTLSFPVGKISRDRLPCCLDGTTLAGNRRLLPGGRTHGVSRMLELPTRRPLAAVAATAVSAVATVLLTAVPAHAAPAGDLLLKSGSLYTENSIVNQGVVPGAAAKSFSFKIVNNGTDEQQYKVVGPSGDPQMSATMFLGSKALRSTYYTAPVAPGSSITLTLKLALAVGTPQGEHFATVTLRDPDTNNYLDSATIDANATYQAGNTSHDLFVKTGSQPYAGGSYGPQFETAAALKVGSSATFALRVQNNGTTAAAIALHGYANFSCPTAYSVTLKQGTKDITGPVYANTYSTPVLAPGAKVDLKLTIKSTATCLADYFEFEATGPDGSVYEYAHVVGAA